MGVYGGVEPTWASQTNTGRTHIATKGIVQSGLVLNLDAGVSSSYSGSGTTWTDLSGSGNNGTLVNGVGYNSGNGGSFFIDATDDYIEASPSVTISSGSNFTFGAFVNPNYIYGNAGFWRDNVSNSFNILQSGNNRPWIRWNASNILQPGSGWSLTTGSWVYVVYTITSSSNAKVYANADLKYNISHTTATPTLNISAIGWQNSLPERIGGNYSQIHYYNRALSAAEVAQNFNATKSRYGL